MNCRKQRTTSQAISIMIWVGLLVLTAFQVTLSQPLQQGVRPSLVADTTAVKPGVPFTVAVKLDIPAGYYTYYRNPGDFGLPTQVAFSAPSGFQVGRARFPAPEIKRQDMAGKMATLYTYQRSTMIMSEIKPPEVLGVGEPITISARVSYQYCQDSGLCFPPKPTTLKLSLPIASARTGARPSADAAAIDAVRRNLPESGPRGKHAKVHAVFSQDRLRPGDRATLGVIVDIASGHKVQLHRPAEPGMISTEVIMDGAAGIEPFPEAVFPDSQLDAERAAAFESSDGYRGRLIIRVPVIARDSLAGPVVKLTGLVRYQACTLDGSCYPPRFASFELDVPVAAKGEKVSLTHADLLAPKAKLKRPGSR